MTDGARSATRPGVRPRQAETHCALQFLRRRDGLVEVRLRQEE
ncbi:hypothetical protein [Micromonospora sp. NPDC050200]